MPIKQKWPFPKIRKDHYNVYESLTYLTADDTPVGIGTFHLIKKWGCRGFIGPFPPPLWISKTSNILFFENYVSYFIIN